MGVREILFLLSIVLFLQPGASNKGISPNETPSIAGGRKLVNAPVSLNVMDFGARGDGSSDDTKVTDTDTSLLLRHSLSSNEKPASYNQTSAGVYRSLEGSLLFLFSSYDAGAGRKDLPTEARHLLGSMQV